MAGRVVLLLLAFILSLSVTQLFNLLAAGLAGVLPGAAGSLAAIAGFVGGRALQYWLCGVLFTMAVGMPWRLSALWVWLGITICNKLASGPGAFSADALLAQVTTFFGVADLLISAAASFHSCRWMEQRENEPWAERGRAMLLGFFNRGSR